MKPAFYAIIIRTSICGLVIAPFFYQLSLILKSVEKDKPFEVNNARRLTIMGVLLIILSTKTVYLWGYCFLSLQVFSNMAAIYRKNTILHYRG